MTGYKCQVQHSCCDALSLSPCMYDHIALSWTDLALGLPLKSRVFCERHMSDELQYRICMRCVAEHVGARPNLHVETVILADTAHANVDITTISIHKVFVHAYREQNLEQPSSLFDHPESHATRKFLLCGMKPRISVYELVMRVG